MTETPQLLRASHNANLSRDWSDLDWASWYLAALDERHRRFEPLRIHSNARIADETEDIYIELPEASRRHMRGGVAQALRCWNQKHHSYGILTGLCWIAAQIRANDAVPTLLQIVKDHRSILFGANNERPGVADDLISILAGFVPDQDERIEALFEDLLFDDSVAPTLSASLAVAITTSTPSAFAKCFNRYYALRERAPHGYFSDEDVVAAFAEAAPRRVIEESVGAMTWGAYTYWITIGVVTKRYSGDDFVVPPSAIIGVDTDGRSDIADQVWPLHGPTGDTGELDMRYKIALDNIKRAGGTQSSLNRPTHVSAVDSVYELAN